MDEIAVVVLVSAWLCRGFLDWFTLAVFVFVIRRFRNRGRLLAYGLLASQTPIPTPDCIAACLLLLHLYICRNFGFWVDQKVPSLVPRPLVGNLLPLLTIEHGPATFFHQVYVGAPDGPCVGFYIFDRPALMIRDPEVLRHVLVKNFPSFVDRLTNARSDTDPLGAANLFCLDGASWKRVRAHSSPVFTSGKLKDVFGDMVLAAERTGDWIWERASRGVAVNVKDVLTRTALDIVCSCLFGIDAASMHDPKSKFRTTGIKMMKWSATRAVEVLGSFFEPRLVRMLPIMLFQRDATAFLRDALLKSDATGLVARSLHGSGGVTEEELQAQSLVFFAAGFETTATTAMLALYELARHLHVQNELRDEVARVLSLHDGRVTYRALQDMHLLDMVVSETLRLYPPMAFLDRVCREDCRLPGVAIRAGTPVFVSLLGIHRDPRHFQEPLEFDPWRFSNENKRRIKPFTYMPFGDGPRSCIDVVNSSWRDGGNIEREQGEKVYDVMHTEGSRFGLLSVKAMLATLLHKFEVQPHPDTPPTLTLTPYSLLLRVLGPLPLAFVVKPVQL